MTDTTQGVELEELQPLENAAEGAPGAQGAGAPGMPPRPPVVGGCVAPAYNPAADKEYYRFFFAGMIMLLGCLMPFGPDYAGAGYKTLGGAFSTLIAVGLLWSWWGAIATNRFSGQNLKWVLLAAIPFFLQLIGLVYAFEAPAVKGWIADENIPMPQNWGELFGALPQALSQKDTDSMLLVSNFFRAYGSGRLVLFVGALMAEVFLVMAIFGGAKEVKAQKKARAAEVAKMRGKGGDAGAAGDGDAKDGKGRRGRKR